MKTPAKAVARTSPIRKAPRASPAKRSASLQDDAAGAVESSNLTDRAYTVVRRLILERELSGGEVLVEGRLAERLSMS